MALEPTGSLAGAERWHHAEEAGYGPLVALRHAAPGEPSREELATRLGWPLDALAALESSTALPTTDQVPEYARALGVSEHEVFEAFTLIGDGLPSPAARRGERAARRAARAVPEEAEAASGGVVEGSSPTRSLDFCESLGR